MANWHEGGLPAEQLRVDDHGWREGPSAPRGGRHYFSEVHASMLAEDDHYSWTHHPNLICQELATPP